MENIISELINIENKAREITEQTEADKKNLPNRIAEQKQLIEERIHKQMDEKILNMQNEKLEESDQRVNRILCEAQEKFSHIEKVYEKNHEKWEDELFNLIIGR